MGALKTDIKPVNTAAIDAAFADLSFGNRPAVGSAVKVKAFQSAPEDLLNDPATLEYLKKSDSPIVASTHNNRAIADMLRIGIRAESSADRFIAPVGEGSNIVTKDSYNEIVLKSSVAKIQRKYEKDNAADPETALAAVQSALLPKYPQGVDPTKLAYNDRLAAPSRVIPLERSRAA